MHFYRLKPETIFHTYYKTVYRYVRSRIYSQQDAEDITSDIFEQIIKKINTFIPNHVQSLRSWIFTIARNKIIDYYRSYRPVLELNEQNIPLSFPEDIDIKIHYIKIINTINMLPNRQKEIILLKYGSELKNKEIAHVLQISEKSVSASISKAKIFIRKHHV